MKKGILIGFALLLSCCVLTGCGSETPKSAEGTDKESPKTSYNFTNLKTDLLSIDNTMQVNEKSAVLVGAEEGYGYILEECSVEVYKFDKTSDAYKTAEKDQKLNLESFGMKLDATVKNGYAYYIENKDDNCGSVISFIEKLN